MAVVFVHLSDIHFGQEKMGGQLVINNDARQQLIEDAAFVVAQLSNQMATGIILTGDIAYAGKRNEYENAGIWLDELTSRVGCSAADIQMVPGNHDIDRDKIKGLTAVMLDAIHDEGESRLDSFLDEALDRDVLYHRFEDYRRFADSYQCPLDCSGKSSAERRVELAAGRAIRFVRLNSALTCTKTRNELGQLLLGARQRVMKEAVGEELIVLAHHPLNWYADFADTARFLKSRARVFITGHEHLAAVDIQNVEEGRDLMLIAAGAATPDRVDSKYTYAYNVIEFDWDEQQDALAVTLHTRTWNDEMKRFEGTDVLLAETNQRTVLGSPNFRRAARPSSLAVEKFSKTAPAHVEIILPKEESVILGSEVDNSEYQNLYLRFFRDLSELERLNIFISLNVIPGEFSGGLKHEMEGKLFMSVVRADRFAQLRDSVEKELDNREQRGEKE